MRVLKALAVLAMFAGSVAAGVILFRLAYAGLALLAAIASIDSASMPGVALPQQGEAAASTNNLHVISGSHSGISHRTSNLIDGEIVETCSSRHVIASFCTVYLNRSHGS
jgi:hypothetical protein